MTAMTKSLTLTHLAALAVAAAFSIAAQSSAPRHKAAVSAPATALATASGNWANTVTITPIGSHIIGNPNARLKLVEYMSYTCSHCAAFEAEGIPTLQQALVAPGMISLEIRHYLLGDPDLAAALLTNCAPPSRFWHLHHDILAAQGTSLAVAIKATPAQQARWKSQVLAERMRAIAADFHFYEIAERNGLSRQVAEACLGNEALARRIAAQAEQGQKLGVEGTPTFFIGTMQLYGTHDWQTLKPQLDARL